MEREWGIGYFAVRKERGKVRFVRGFSACGGSGNGLERLDSYFWTKVTDCKFEMRWRICSEKRGGR